MRVPTTERRLQLIEAAVELMRRNGVDQVTLRAIAQQAGAPLATLHYCFRDKDELMRAAADHWLERFVHDPVPDEVPLEGGLRAVMDRISAAFWTLIETTPADLRAQIELVTWAVRDATHPALAESMYSRYEVTLGDVFARALDAAGQRSEVDPRVLARGYIAAVDGAVLQYISEPASPRPREVFDLMVEALLLRAGILER
ncbi:MULTISPECIES: TetR family transcriptional regulator [unclassified Streptomyces]|uniref:TetR/AcrR family transcriptional regulator n=1 Tax=unclassified Streptomyces TaxID=2593676 RepID=UPI0034020E41